MKTFLILFFLLSVTSLQADSFQDYVNEKKQSISHQRHLPYTLSHGYKTKISVLLIHGTFSSPLYFRQMAERFFDKGYNVITILLPGHWDKNIYQMDHITNQSWSEETDRGYRYALDAGERVILAGHSLGGLLAIEQAIKRPASEVAGLFLLSPSIELKEVVIAACFLGKSLRLDGNLFPPSTPNEVNVPYFAPRAGLLIRQLYHRVDYSTLKTPMYMAYTWADQVVRVHTLKSFYAYALNPKKVRVYSLTSGVQHANIGQGKDDVQTYPSFKANYDFEIMMNEGINFLEQF